jgi:hypothetical protein
MWQDQGKGKALAGPPSTENDHFAATQEITIDRLHPKAQVRTGHVTQPGTNGGHGTYIIYSPLQNIQGQSHWYYVDTTGEVRIPISESEGNMNEYYNPFIEGFPADQDQFNYEEIKTTALIGLRSLAATGANPEGYNEKLSINDEFAEGFYNDIVVNDKEAEGVLNVLEPAVDYEVENDEYVSIVGTPEEAVVVNGDENLHNALMNETTSRSKEEVFNYLETGKFAA